MTTDEMKQVTRSVFEEVWNKGNLDVLDDTIGPDVVFHVSGWGDVRGPDGFREFVTSFRSAFPDLRIRIEEQIAEGDLIATRWTWTGTHEGEFMGIAPTHRQVRVSGITLGRVAEDRRGESWIEGDTLGLLQQLGAVPEALAAAA